jgi:hypothetical protein
MSSEIEGGWDTIKESIDRCDPLMADLLASHLRAECMRCHKLVSFSEITITMHPQQVSFGDGRVQILKSLSLRCAPCSNGSSLDEMDAYNSRLAANATKDLKQDLTEALAKPVTEALDRMTGICPKCLTQTLVGHKDGCKHGCRTCSTCKDLWHFCMTSSGYFQVHKGVYPGPCDLEAACEQKVQD